MINSLLSKTDRRARSTSTHLFYAVKDNSFSIVGHLSRSSVQKNPRAGSCKSPQAERQSKGKTVSNGEFFLSLEMSIFKIEICLLDDVILRQIVMHLIRVISRHSGAVNLTPLLTSEIGNLRSSIIERI